MLAVFGGSGGEQLLKLDMPVLPVSRLLSGEAQPHIGQTHLLPRDEILVMLIRMTPEHPPSAEPSLGLGPLERAIMEAIWQLGSATVADVREALGERNAYTTIMTVMSRLTDKGRLVREKRGRSFLYRTASSRVEHTGAWLAGALATGDIGQRGTLVQHFVGNIKRLDAGLLDELEAAVRRAQAEADR